MRESTVSRVSGTLPAWWPDAAFAGVVGVVGLLGAMTSGPLLPRVVVALLMSGAAGCFRLLPGLALGLVWLTGLCQLAERVGPMLVEVSVAAVAFGCARFGSAAVVWLSGLSIPAAAVVGALWSLRLDLTTFQVSDVLPIGARMPVSTNELGALAPALMVGLVLPWLLGLGLRLLAGSREAQFAAETRRAEAEQERGQAEEIARLREGQARLARDVHDVVGHSLAVILAQAESAQFLRDADTEKMRQVLGHVADSARHSLQDVRRVLTSTASGAADELRSEGLERLLEGVRAAGNDVRVIVLGAPVSLPPELDVVAYRVLQEMLTNALKHGQRGTAVLVEQVWADRWSTEELRLEVCNSVAPSDPTDPSDPTQPVSHAGGAGVPEDGMGLRSMRQRLEAVGGRLDVRLRDDTFTATAWLPLRARELG